METFRWKVLNKVKIIIICAEVKVPSDAASIPDCKPGSCCCLRVHCNPASFLYLLFRAFTGLNNFQLEFLGSLFDLPTHYLFLRMCDGLHKAACCCSCLLPEWQKVY